VQALAVAAERRGASIEQSRVLAVEGGANPRVVTDTGAFDADAVIVAAGAWSDAVERPRREPGHVKPIRGQLLHLRLPARPAARILWGSRCYLVPWRDGTVLVGATSEDAGFDETATAAGVRHLLTAGVELLPPLAGAAFAGVRVGLRPMTGDELPAIGASSTMRGMFYATGHYRNGVLLAPLTAVLLADLVLEGREATELALVRPARLGL
jgi:glycine oxidase